MVFKMAELPYENDALAPYISLETIEFHYGKHYKGYVDNLNKLIVGTKYEQMSLEEIIKETYGKPELIPIFNNAAQTWNHEFFWKSMKPNGGGNPQEELKTKIEHNFGNLDKFKEEFKTAAVAQFGSGWVWLVEDEGRLKIVKTGNADNPLTKNMKPILTLDVWEHAYYLDYQNRRLEFANVFLEHLINW